MPMNLDHTQHIFMCLKMLCPPMQKPPSTTITCTINPIFVHCLCPPKAQSPKVISPCTTAQVWDVMALNRAFPNSINTIGNMPGTFAIRTDPSVPPVQQSWSKVPIEYWEQIEHTVNDMVTKGVIAPVSWLTKWDEICHSLSGATCFSKLNAKDGFWSIHLDENSSYLTMFNMHHGRYRFLQMPFSRKMSQDVFQMQMDQAADHLPGINVMHDDTCIFGHTLRSTMSTSCT